MAEQDQAEKTEEPTQHKLDESKKKGVVSKSHDISSLVALGSALVVLTASGQSLTQRLFDLCRKTITNAGQMTFDLPHVSSWLASSFEEGLFVLSPLFAVLIITGVLVGILQTGFVFSFFPMKPDFAKLNPVEGFKRLFSLRLLFETAKNIVKLLLFAVISYFTLAAWLPRLLALVAISPDQYVSLFLEFTATLTFKLLVALALIALLDFLFVRWDYVRRMRMSKHELKEEIKRRDGDPHVKQRRKEIQKELRKKMGVLNKVPDADVIVTNPVSLAVLLKYDRQAMIAPMIIGKASGEMVQAVREAAYRYRVPVIENRLLARMLYRKSRLDSLVPPGSFVEVARVFRKAYLQSGRFQGASA